MALLHPVNSFPFIIHLPVLIGFGFVASAISSKATTKLIKASGFIVIILGLIMVNRGLAISGSGLDSNSLITSVSAATGELDGNTAMLSDPSNGEMEFQEIKMEVTRSGWEPDKFVLKKDVPVKWIINGKELTGCNNAIQVPEYDLEFDIKKGEQIIEFTPTKEGVISWSCWMGMIPGTFIVKEDVDLKNKAEVKKVIEKASANQPTKAASAGICGGSCGSSTCEGSTGGSCGCGG